MVDIPFVEFKKNSKQCVDLEILRVQDLFSRADRLPFRMDAPHQVSFHHIILVTKGAGKHFVDFRPYEFRKGSLIFVTVGQVHAFDLRSGMEGHVVLFTERFISRTPMVYTRNHLVLGEGNFVLAVSEGIFLGKHSSFYDLFRIESGKVVEHWDTIEEIPLRSDWKNTNGKFTFPGG